MQTKEKRPAAGEQSRAAQQILFKQNTSNEHSSQGQEDDSKKIKSYLLKKPALPAFSALLGDCAYTGCTPTKHQLNLSPWKTVPKQSVVAKEISKILRGRIVRDGTTGKWWRNTGKHYEETTKDAVFSFFREFLDRKIQEGYSHSFLAGIYKFVRIDLVVKGWCSDTNLVPMTNGVLNIHERKIQPYSSKQRFNWHLPYNFEPKATAPIFMGYLKSTANGDKNFIDLMQAILAAIITGRTDLQKFFELLGPGGTGKSTFQETCTKLIGKGNYVSTDLKKLETNNFETAQLYGKKLILISDSSRYGKEVSVLKAITGGDYIRFEEKNRQQGEPFQVQGIVLIAANEPIQSSDYTSGLSRRRVTIPFIKNVTDAEKAKFPGGIEKAITAELPGILNWALRLSKEVVTKRIEQAGRRSKSSRTAVDTNPMLAWINDSLVPDVNSILYVGSQPSDTEESWDNKLYPSYWKHCRKAGRKPIALNRFSGNLEDQCQAYGIMLERLPRDKNGNRYQGLAHRNDSHISIPTPITKELLVQGAVDSMQAETSGSAENAGSVGISETSETSDFSGTTHEWEEI